MPFAELPILEKQSIPLGASGRPDRQRPYRPHDSVELNRMISSKQIINILVFSNVGGPTPLGIWWIWLRIQNATAM
jgi:hypothetical protein